MINNVKLQRELEIAKQARLEKKDLHYTAGQALVLRAALFTKVNYNTEELVFNDIIWEENYESFLGFMRYLEVETFIVTNTSTGLMSLVHYLVSNGCQLVEAVQVELKDTMFEENETVKGLKFKIK